MQSNANRLRNILKKTKTLLFVLGILIIIFDLKDMQILSTIIGIIWTISILIWWWFDNYLWKKPWINKKLKFSKNFYCPPIDGRWEGQLTRDGEKHDFVVEIKQTYTSISCETYSLHSHSKCNCAEILYDAQNDYYSFVFLWQGKSSKSPDGKDEPSNDFLGTTILRINENCTSLDGFYFTNRNPKQTKGEINLNTRQETLKNKF